MFRRYHYLNTDLHKAATQYIGMIGNELVAHTGIIQFPMHKGWKRVHRFVVLPDYQGIGIGTRFINAVAEDVLKCADRLNLTTSTPALTHALRRSKNWILLRAGRSKGSGYKKIYGGEHINAQLSNNRITYSFWYRRIDNGIR